MGPRRKHTGQRVSGEMEVYLFTPPTKPNVHILFQRTHDDPDEPRCEQI